MSPKNEKRSHGRTLNLLHAKIYTKVSIIGHRDNQVLQTEKKGSMHIFSNMNTLSTVTDKRRIGSLSTGITLGASNTQQIVSCSERLVPVT